MLHFGNACAIIYIVVIGVSLVALDSVVRLPIMIDDYGMPKAGRLAAATRAYHPQDFPN